MSRLAILFLLLSSVAHANPGASARTMHAEIISTPLALLAETYLISIYLRLDQGCGRRFRHIYLPFTFITYLIFIGVPYYGEYHFAWLRELPDWYHILTAEICIVFVETIFVAWLCGSKLVEMSKPPSILKVSAAILLGNLVSFIGGEFLAEALGMAI